MIMKTVFLIQPKEYDKLKKICEDTKNKDESFIFEFIKGPYTTSLSIESSDEKQAKRRGMWIKKIIERDFKRKANFKVI